MNAPLLKSKTFYFLHTLLPIQEEVDEISINEKLFQKITEILNNDYENMN